MGLMKGRQIDNVRAYVFAHEGTNTWLSVLDQLPQSDRAALYALAPAEWYDVQVYARLVRGVCEHLGGDRQWTAQQIGRFGAERDFTGIHRWFLRLLRPSFAIGNMNVYWRRTQDTGIWTSEIHGREICARLKDWDAVDGLVCQRLLGYLARALELMRCNRLKIAHSSCRASGASVCEFRAECDLPVDRTSVGRIASEADIADMARELTQMEDRNNVAEAILDLVCAQFGFRYASLWISPTSEAQSVCLRSVGMPVGRPERHHVLETRGRLIGRLSVSAPDPSLLREEDALLLERLLPHFAIALADADPGTGLRVDVPPIAIGSTATAPPAVAMGQRLALARERWKLTPRETAVLGCCALGRTNKDIAAELDCAEGTVEVHMSRLFKKSGAENRAGLVGRFWAAS